LINGEVFMKLRDIVLGASLALLPLSGCDKHVSSSVEDKVGNVISFNMDEDGMNSSKLYHLNIKRKDGKIIEYHASNENKVYQARIINGGEATNYNKESILDNEVMEEFQRDYDKWIGIIQQARKEDALKTLRPNPAEAPSVK